jgi:hypothetical protein
VDSHDSALALNLGRTDHAHVHDHDHAFAQGPYSEGLVMGINSSLVLVDNLGIDTDPVRDPGSDSARNHHTVDVVDTGVETVAVGVDVEAIVVDVDYNPYSESDFSPRAKESSEEEQVIQQPHTTLYKEVMRY